MNLQTHCGAWPFGWNLWITAAVATLLVSRLPLSAQDKPVAAVAESEEAKHSREELQLSLEQVAPIRLQHAGTGAEIERIDHPVFRHSSPLWGGHHGTVWIWGKRGRPVAVLEMFQVLEQRLWYQQLHATTDVPIKMTMPEDKVIHHDPAVNFDEILANTNSHWRTTSKVKEPEGK